MRFSTSVFSAMSDLVNLLREKIREEERIWTEANRDTMILPLQEYVSIHELIRITGHCYAQIRKFCMDGSFPGSKVERRGKSQRPFLYVEVNTYKAIVKIYKETDSIAGAASQYGCSE